MKQFLQTQLHRITENHTNESANSYETETQNALDYHHDDIYRDRTITLSMFMRFYVSIDVTREVEPVYRFTSTINTTTIVKPAVTRSLKQEPKEVPQTKFDVRKLRMKIVVLYWLATK